MLQPEMLQPSNAIAEMLQPDAMPAKLYLQPKNAIAKKCYSQKLLQPSNAIAEMLQPVAVLEIMRLLINGAEFILLTYCLCLSISRHFAMLQPLNASKHCVSRIAIAKKCYSREMLQPKYICYSRAMLQLKCYSRLRCLRCYSKSCYSRMLQHAIAKMLQPTTPTKIYDSRIQASYTEFGQK